MTFAESLLIKTCHALGEWHEDNYDADRFGKPTLERRVRDWVKTRINHRNYRALGRASSNIQPHLAGLEKTWQLLEDEASRSLLVDLMAYRILGHRHVKLPTNTPDFWATLQRLKAIEAAATDQIDTGHLHFRLSRMNLAEFGAEMEAYVRPSAIMAQLFIEQYRLLAGDTSIGVHKGGVVFDCGGCWGETAIHFAEQAGEQGRVVSFEFVPSNLAIFRSNLDLNPELKERITVVENPIWSEEGGELYFEDRGPASKVDTKPFDGSSDSVTIRTIDSVAEELGLDRVSFIKMDIEGAELPALRGANQTIRNHRPDLAISVYHSVEEFHTIPAYLNSLGLGYRFWLKHATIHAEETVLFATAD